MRKTVHTSPSSDVPSAYPKERETSSPVVFTLHLLAFCICAWIAYRRNIGELFWHWDGLTVYAYVRNQILTSAAGIALSNDFLQEVGNIQMPNYRLLFFFCPVFISAVICIGVL